MEGTADRPHLARLHRYRRVKGTRAPQADPVGDPPPDPADAAAAAPEAAAAAISATMSTAATPRPSDRTSPPIATAIQPYIAGRPPGKQTFNQIIRNVTRRPST